MGGNSLFFSHYTDWVYLQIDFPVDRIVHRILGHPDLALSIKPVHTTIDPQIRDLSPTVREWFWEAVDTLPYSYESGQPIWYRPYAHVEMSQYKTWDEIAQKFYPLYALSLDFSQSVPSEMQAVVDQWKQSSACSLKRALQALRFVQDEIRYLGIEEGMGAFQPTDPRLTFQRRFGDCKDKAFLLHALLQLMGIRSTPLLVHTCKGAIIPHMLPTPYAFNHLVLQLEIGGQHYWVDPTLSLQGGSLSTSFFPNYKWGLLLSNHSEGLIALPQVHVHNPTEIATSFNVASEEKTYLQMTSVFYAGQADRLRRSLEWNGVQKIADDALSDMQELYGEVSWEAPLEVVDDREGNSLTLVESYSFPTRQYSGVMVSYTFRDYLHRQINPERASRVSVAHAHVDN